DPDREGLILTMALAVLVALAIKVVGALLIVSMLIIPAAAVRPLASTPERMGLLAALTGVLAVLGGIWGSFTWDTPTGPSIVVSAGAIFALGALARRPED
ncbi:MAG: metal ABC transporter permease, partial [Pseudomonadota bacterium]